MARIVKVYVVDDQGNGLQGQNVKTYHGAIIKTDRSGCASLVIEASKVTIYVNGSTAFDGSASRLDAVEVFTKSGGRP